jgi:hypothetical protein
VRSDHSLELPSDGKFCLLEAEKQETNTNTIHPDGSLEARSW